MVNKSESIELQIGMHQDCYIVDKQGNIKGILKYMFHNLKIINFISSDNGTLAQLLYPLDSRWSAMKHQLI